MNKCWMCGAEVGDVYKGKEDVNGWIHDSCDAFFDKTLLQVFIQDIYKVSDVIAKSESELSERLRPFQARGLVTPDMGVSNDHDMLMMAFDNGDHHLEFEMLETGKIEVFYLHRTTNWMWETELDQNLLFTPELLEKLELFIKGKPMSTDVPVVVGPKHDGPIGSCGPNDYGYMIMCVRRAAKELYAATDLYSEGHYPHSNAKLVPEDHPLSVAMRELAKFDKEFAWYANLEHDPKLFEPHKPTQEAMTRWDAAYLKGPAGIP